MGQINSTNLPQYAPDAQLASTSLRSSAAATALQETIAPQDDMQLTKLSSVLSSLKKGASIMRSQAAQVMKAVRSGTYQVDPLQVSRSIVGESLVSN
jgi:hypothetical protein